jgi:hypothetical protein
MNGLIEHWSTYKARLEAAAAAGAGVPVSGVRLRPPVPAPRTIDCMAVNYMEDGTQQRAGAYQRFPQIAERYHRAWRHHGTAGRAGHLLRGRG